MTKENIEKLISEKSEPIKEIYNNIYYAVDIKFEIDFDNNIKSILSYNMSIILMELIHNNTSYFIPLFEIQPNELEMIEEDLNIMEHIDYPENIDGMELFLTDIEEDFRDNIIFRMENDLRMEQYYETNDNEDK